MRVILKDAKVKMQCNLVILVKQYHEENQHMYAGPPVGEGLAG